MSVDNQQPCAREKDAGAEVGFLSLYSSLSKGLVISV